LGAVSISLGKRSKFLPIGNFVDGAMGTIGLGLVIASCSLPLKPQVNCVATDLKDLSRCAFSHAIQLNCINDFLPQIVTVGLAHVHLLDSVVIVP